MRSSDVVASVAALVGGMLLCTNAPAASKAYLAFQLREKVVLYAQIDGDQLRFATSEAGLEAARPIKGTSERSGSKWPETALTIPTETLPPGCTGIKATVSTFAAGGGSGSRVYAQVTFSVSQVDDKKSVWTIEAAEGGPTAQSIKQTRPISIPTADTASFEVGTQPVRRDDGNLAIGIRLTIGSGAEVSDVRKDGKPVEVSLTVKDAKDAVVASASKPLGQFGFS